MEGTAARDRRSRTQLQRCMNVRRSYEVCEWTRTANPIQKIPKSLPSTFSCLELGLPNALNPGMPVMRILLSKFFTFGLIVRAFTSPRPFG
jgi:hypothetical protein